MRRPSGNDTSGESPAMRRTARSWPASDQPREKLLRCGAASLSDAELLALLLRTGTQWRSALDVAREVLQRDRSLRTVARRNARELMRVGGIGEVKAAGVLAAFEIGRRLQADSGETPTVVQCPEDAARLIIPRVRDLTYEVFIVLVLDARNAVIADVELSRGTLTSSVIHPREVFKVAVDYLGAAVLVAHNHPTGTTEPSREDLEITRQLVEAGKLLGIPLHDHLIIGGNAFASLAERGLM